MIQEFKIIATFLNNGNQSPNLYVTSCDMMNDKLVNKKRKRRVPEIHLRNIAFEVEK